jgi:ribonuclease-3
LKILRKFLNKYFPSAKDRAFVQKLRHLLGFTPTNLAIFKLAFKHSSKSTTAHTNNERLEYLGDAVLDAIVSDWLFKRYAIKGEGFLTEVRSKIVNRKRLGDVGGKLNLQQLLDYDKGYVTINSTILGNALEALIGAIYLDAGYEKTRYFVMHKMIHPYIDLDELQRVDINYKSRVFEWAQKYDKELTFKVLEEKNDAKYRIFVVGSFIDGQLMGKGEGRSKKDAQKLAAKEIYETLNIAASMNW